MFPDSWAERIVCPVYIAGSEYYPNNYIGISITANMYKIIKYYKINACIVGLKIVIRWTSVGLV